MKPIIPPKYDIGFIVKNSNIQLLEALEPWCSTIYTDNDRMKYISVEQPKTAFILDDKIKPYDNEKNNQILIQIDGLAFTEQDYLYINQLSEIIADSGELGSFDLGNLYITINNLQTYESELVICKK